MIMKVNKKLQTLRCVVMLLGVAIVCSLGSTAEQNSSPLDEVHDGLKLNDIETQMLSTVSDGTPSSEESGFYMMMGKVALLPKLTDGSLKELEAPGYKNVMRTPNRFRYQPLAMQVRIYTVAKLTVKNRRISAHGQYWPIQKPMWEIFCTTTGKTPDIEHNQPLILYSSVIPTGLLDKGKKVDDDKWNFTKGPSFVFAGVFYKVVKKNDRATNTARNYPVFLVWQVGIVSVAAKHWSLDVIPGVLIVLGLLTGGILFVKLRRRIKRKKNELQRGTIFKNYTPLRDSDDDIYDTKNDDKAIDPELTQAAREYRKDHGIDDR
jgi:hypothetical protein